MGEASLTAVILTLNEAAHIVDCIQSLDWADNILVLDSYSQDETVELAQRAGAQISQHPFKNYAEQRNAALEMVQTDWVFFVDADERGTPELGAEIKQIMGTREEAGWHVPRLNYIFGRLTKGAGWFPDYQLRFFRHGKVRYERPVHEVAVVDGEIGHLQQPLIHHNYRDVAHFHETQREYTRVDAGILHQQGITPKFYTPYSQPLRQFYWRFIILKGYVDGFHGLRLCLYLAYYEWVKYRELRNLRMEN